jgi:flagellar basal-body rod protein FlgB
VDSSFKVLQNIIQATDARQKVLSSNIANSDTPGFKAKDVKFGNLLEKEVKLLTTDPKHIGRSKSSSLNGKMVVEKNPSWGDKNNVELSAEVAKMTENALLHDAAIKILNSKMKMFKAAISSRR